MTYVYAILGRKDKVMKESLHLSDLMDDEVFQMTRFRKLVLFLTFFPKNFVAVTFS